MSRRSELRQLRAATSLILDHAPVLGPQHWHWRCLVCSEDVALHGTWRERWRWRREQRRLTH